MTGPRRQVGDEVVDDEAAGEVDADAARQPPCEDLQRSGDSTADEDEPEPRRGWDYDVEC